MVKAEILNLELIKIFVAKLKSSHIESTGANVVNISDDLYNLDGSTDDPKDVPDHQGESWKGLLIAKGIDNDCYVTNANAGGSHAEFSVGGHMTPNANGKVADGGTCYLMPLCSWHNHKARDGVQFTHTQTKMLELTGYNLGELRITFELRLPSDQPFAVLFHHENEWKFKNISRNQADSLKESVFNHFSPRQSIDHYVLIERKMAVNTIHQVITSNLP